MFVHFFSLAQSLQTLHDSHQFLNVVIFFINFNRLYQYSWRQLLLKAKQNSHVMLRQLRVRALAPATLFSTFNSQQPLFYLQSTSNPYSENHYCKQFPVMWRQHYLYSFFFDLDKGDILENRLVFILILKQANVLKLFSCGWKKSCGLIFSLRNINRFTVASVA